ncbi:unnamed protein product [Dicrocoelium dendriticum]|nr:unnamed protein product [Dicrocoelium dendriticum]
MARSRLLWRSCSNMPFLNGTSVLCGLSGDEKERLAQQRERSDKISQLMGNYLLKGWRMLDETCHICGTVTFEPPSGGRYCIACSEVDVTPTSISDQLTTPAVTGPDTFGTAHLAVQAGSVDCKPSVRCYSPSAKMLLDDMQRKLFWCVTQMTDTDSQNAVVQWTHTIKCVVEAMNAIARCEYLSS